MGEQPDWMRETMHDLRTDSPYYHEMQETLRDHYREMDILDAEQRLNDYLDSLDYTEDDEEGSDTPDDDPLDPRHY